MKNLFDHTYLKPDAVLENINKLCDEAMLNDFHSVCVSPIFVTACYYKLLHFKTKVCTVVSFPHGNILVPSKTREVELIMSYVDEFDVVIDLNNVKSHNWEYVEHEVKLMRNATANTILKYIIEIGYLTDEEINRVCEILIRNKVDFVKTCTGYGPRNVTVDDIIKLKKICGNDIKIKASGGIKTLDFSNQLIDAGANRLGTSSSVDIIKEYNTKFVESL